LVSPSFRHWQNHPHTNSSFLLLGCRDAEKGTEAIQELREKGIASSVEPPIIDVTSDVSIQDAVAVVKRQYGRLDLLVNNAGYAAVPSASDHSHSDWREIYTSVYDTNVTSVGLVMQHFLPLLRGSAGRVINISSARGSTTLASGNVLPPTVSIPYSVSKAALNLLTVD